MNKNVRTTKWEEMDAATGGRFDARYRELRRKLLAITIVEAKIIVLGNEGFAEGDIANIMGIYLETVYNHVSSVRNKLNAPRDVQFKDLFALATMRQDSNAEEKWTREFFCEIISRICSYLCTCSLWPRVEIPHVSAL